LLRPRPSARARVEGILLACEMSKLPQAARRAASDAAHFSCYEECGLASVPVDAERKLLHPHLHELFSKPSSLLRD
jgi:hypothetical protein